MRAVGSTSARISLDTSRDLLTLLWSTPNMAPSSAWVVPPFLRISESSRACRMYSLDWFPGSDARTVIVPEEGYVSVLLHPGGVPVQDV